MEKTLGILKPGVIERTIVGNIITRVEQSGLKLVALKMSHLSSSQCQVHYAEHRGKPFFTDLVSYMTSSPVVLFVAAGVQAVLHLRRLVGATNPQEAPPGSIRGDFALEMTANVIHASDSVESAAREIDIFFEPHEILY